MQSIRSWIFTRGCSLTAVIVMTTSVCLAGGVPPVRVAVVPGGGSGIEQDAVDRISSELDGLTDVAVSTVNPDWYVVCNIQEHVDQASGQIRYNGTVTVKTTDGHVISTVAVQKYNQDFSLQPGAPLNKKLVDSAAREVIDGMSQRTIGPIEHAVQVEMETRDRILRATALTDEDKYEEAIALLSPITPETSHFRTVRDLLEDCQMEGRALQLVRSGESKAKQKHYAEAIQLLKGVDSKSKRSKLARSRIASYRAALSAHQH